MGLAPTGKLDAQTWEAMKKDPEWEKSSGINDAGSDHLDFIDNE